jgi:hypothetical protein
MVLPMFAGFVFFGTAAGGALGGVTLVALVAVAIRSETGAAIEVAEPGAGVPGGVLVLAIAPIEDPRTAGIVASIADPSRPETGRDALLVIAPARGTLLDRWADDLERARFESQRILAVSLATLAAAGIEAEGRVGDGDPLRAAEDVLRSYAATEVVIVAEEGQSERQLNELERRLDRPLRRVVPTAPA